MHVTGVDDVIASIERIGRGSDKIFKETVFIGAGIVADEIKKRLKIRLNTHESTSLKGNGKVTKTTKPSGDLLASFGITPIRQNADGNYDAKIGFHGYDRKGVANKLKARVMESGSSTVKKRPFVQPSISASRKRAKGAMKVYLLTKLKQLQGE